MGGKAVVDRLGGQRSATHGQRLHEVVEVGVKQDETVVGAAGDQRAVAGVIGGEAGVGGRHGAAGARLEPQRCGCRPDEQRG